MQVHRPATLDEALQLMQRPDARPQPIAGGTDLLVSWHHRAKESVRLMDMSRLEELRTLRLTNESLEIGALATYWDVITSAEISETFPLLAQAAKQVGAMQIQTRGTWAGNIGNGSPAADGVPVLMAYDATVTLASSRGRRDVALCDYWTGYKKSVKADDELIVGIRVPRRACDFEWFHKVGARAAQAITKVGVAMVHSADGWRVTANSVAPFVCRCRAMEAALDRGEVFQGPDDVRQVISRDVSPIDDLRSTAAYRLAVLSRLVFFRMSGHL
ncbi:MAG: FAD binding domain-containing protein [Planctomycetes bacterium]|nr:FAD binding domain-containing protein [Planctomycetota bacterium]